VQSFKKIYVWEKSGSSVVSHLENVIRKDKKHTQKNQKNVKCKKSEV